MIIDGERRWRGSIKAGRTTIRAWVNPNPGDDGDRLLRQAVLNEGRRLKPMEEARTWARIRAAKGWNIQQLAEAVGRPKSTVSDRLALLNAPAPFQPLIASGVLPAAAAPIMRRYSDVPERIVTALVKEISKAELSDFIATQTPIPLAQFENALRHSTYAAGLRNVTHSKDVAKSYEGEMVTIDGQRYATDAKAWDAHSAAHWKRQTSSDSADRAPSKADKERQQREAAERKRQQLKLQTRRAQFHAISAKLPTSIGGSANGADWSQLLVDLVMQEVHQDTLRVLAAQLKLTGEKSRTGGMSHYGDMVKRHAKTLSSQGRVKLAMQLLLAPDINIPAYIARGPERFAAAAKLAKLDLSKIKPPADEKAKKAPAKPSAKKRR
jgi:ParB-like chromosome segregation protein Spo0J